MNKVEHLLFSINRICKADEDDLKDQLSEFPEVDATVKSIEDFEKKVAKLLRRQRKFFVDGVNSFVSKDVTLAALLAYVTQDLFAEDEFASEMEDLASAFLTLTISELTSQIMESIDKDIAFNTLSKRTTDWIESWAKDLGELMKLSSHEALEKELKEVLENGESIDKAVERIKDLPEFDRKRARTTAITEILTASSVSQHEAYLQSPAVTKKRWRHSGSKKNNPRKAHQDLDGTEIPVDEDFDVNGHTGAHPRDTRLPASERVNCHCVLSPVVDKTILGLSAEEKEEIRRQVLEELEE